MRRCAKRFGMLRRCAEVWYVAAGFGGLACCGWLRRFGMLRLASEVWHVAAGLARVAQKFCGLSPPPPSTRCAEILRAAADWQALRRNFAGCGCLACVAQKFCGLRRGGKSRRRQARVCAEILRAAPRRQKPPPPSARCAEIFCAAAAKAAAAKRALRRAAPRRQKPPPPSTRLRRNFAGCAARRQPPPPSTSEPRSIYSIQHTQRVFSTHATQRQETGALLVDSGRDRRLLPLGKRGARPGR